MPTISVIVPVYKVEKYLNKCIDTILDQTFTDFELILIDDGSPDKCGQICDEYAKKDSRIVVIHQENQGISGARNSGIAICKGEYISFIDSDDYVAPYYLESLYSVASEHKLSMVVGDAIRVNDDNYKFNRVKQNPTILDNHEAILTRMMKNSVILWGKLYKKDLFETVHFPIGKINEDNHVIHLLYYNAEKIGFINEIIYAYLQRDNSIMGDISLRKKNIKYFDGLDAYIEWINFFHDKDGYDDCCKQTINMFWEWYFWNIPQDMSKDVIEKIKGIPNKGLFLKYHFRSNYATFKGKCRLALLLIFPQLYKFIFIR